MSKPAKALDRHICELVLLALHDEGVARVSFQDAEIELGDQFARGAIPDPEFGLDQTAGDDVVDEAQAVEDFKRRRMRGRGARIVVDPLLGLKDLNRKTLARQRQRRDDADRPAAGNEDRALERHFPAFYAGRSVAAIRRGGIACWAISRFTPKSDQIAASQYLSLWATKRHSAVQQLVVREQIRLVGEK